MNIDYVFYKAYSEAWYIHNAICLALFVHTRAILESHAILAQLRPV